ncbi:MAG: glycine--tRNA ligase [Bacteroidota bacterium]
MAQQDDNLLKKIISHAKEYGFIFPSSEIYDGLSAVYDYGQNGVELKNNIKEYWWKFMTLLHDEIVGIDTAIFMHPTIWKASGHVDAFNDPMVDNRDSKKRYRADQLIEVYIEKQEEKIEKEVEKAAKRFGDSFDKEMFLKTNGRVLELQQKIDEVNSRLKDALASSDMVALKQIIEDLEIACPVSGSRNWTEVRQFNLMFSTEMGSVADDANKIYLRPETAQGIFVNFLNVQKTGRMKVPFGIAQIGKAFRNEIVARQFIFRMREFEQMEMQFFVRPGTQQQWYEYWKEERLKWHLALGIPSSSYRYHDHVKLAHYADAACDIEFEFPIGFKELEGIHSRTDFDLKQHQEFSKKKQQYFDNEVDPATGKPYGNYIPYVIETSIGLDRMFLAVLSHAYEEQDLSTPEKTDSRVVLKLPAALAPIKMAVLPLNKKDGLPEIAEEIIASCRNEFRCFYEEKDSIGKRYRRMDALGTPFCVTVDYQTKEDQTVTIRHRDSMEQERVPITALKELVLKAMA